MRAALLVLALLAIASPGAMAQEPARYRIPEAPPRQSLDLRGPIAPAAPVSPTAPAAPVVDGEMEAGQANPVGAAASVRWMAPSDRGAERQCRSACDRSYYQCLSSDDADACPSGWGQCRSRCERRRS